MSDKSTQEWSSYWADNASTSGEVFVNAKGETHPELAQWWRDTFTTLPKSGRLIDLACGAGSVFQHIPTEHSYELHGADISTQALSQLKELFPSVNRHQCPADSLPFADGEFDVVVSQFGVEYAGMEGFHEAARVVGPGGSLVIVSHLEESFIDGRNRDHLYNAQVIVECDFIPRARALIAAMFSGDQEKTQRAANAFTPSEQALAKAVKRLPEGIHAHLYFGFKQLFERRVDYHLKDITQWLKDMADDVDRNILRLESMCQAARSEPEIRGFVEKLRESGWVSAQYETLRISNHNQPLAWIIKGQKQAT